MPFGAGSNAALLTAMEKRWNFAIGDTSARAHAFEEFMHCIEEMTWQENEKTFRIAASRLDVNLIPQWFRYDRNADLELWTLELCQQP